MMRETVHRSRGGPLSSHSGKWLVQSEEFGTSQIGVLCDSALCDLRYCRDPFLKWQ